MLCIKTTVSEVQIIAELYLISYSIQDIVFWINYIQNLLNICWITINDLCKLNFLLRICVYFLPFFVLITSILPNSVFSIHFLRFIIFRTPNLRYLPIILIHIFFFLRICVYFFQSCYLFLIIPPILRLVILL